MKDGSKTGIWQKGVPWLTQASRREIPKASSNLMLGIFYTKNHDKHGCYGKKKGSLKHRTSSTLAPVIKLDK